MYGTISRLLWRMKGVLEKKLTKARKQKKEQKYIKIVNTRNIKPLYMLSKLI